MSNIGLVYNIKIVRLGVVLAGYLCYTLGCQHFKFGEGDV